MAARLFSIGLCIGLTVFAASAAAPAEAATVSAAPGSVGYDISFPQCTSATAASPVPSSATFSILGVTAGKPFNYYSCLGTWYQQAAAAGVTPGLYVNTANPGPSAQNANWPTPGTLTPAACATTSPDDSGCAYDYGYAAGQNAVAGAKNRAGDAVTAGIWWLDVEVGGNTWAPAGAAITSGSAADKVSNAAVLQGEMDGLYAAGVAQVGIYSTGLQWQEITGGYNSADAASYEQAWNLTPNHPMSKAPLWVPTGSFDEYQAYRACAQSFTGAPALLAQYLVRPTPATALDADLVCGGAAPVSIAGAPRSPVAKAGKKRGTVSLSWQAPTSNGGEPITGYLIYRGTSGGHLSAYQTVACTTGSCSWTDSSAKHGKRYYYKVAAVTEVGTGHQSTYVTTKGK